MVLDKTGLRDAATVIVLRDRDTRPRVLMGQRGAKAAFMPNKFVFPGGAVDAEDAEVPLARPLPPLCAARLTENAPEGIAHALAVAAVRELWEETGLVLGRSGTWTDPPPPCWRRFAATGHLPDASALQFVFRAITPPGRPRRFDARFFLLEAEELASDPDDFSAACDELSHLHWIALDEVRRLDLPFITEVVLGEIAARAQDASPPASVPFFRNDDEQSLFLRLYGAPQPD
ncbi:NUDIX hydrolase [Salipiger marinus]|uniref:8-oxo-dGTP pyrophosphatase MutT, NUDIX family n=1 Tax=Salipiger marinus TaxID=555512 RepID=A0A1G8JSN6_9RHOB|nr:NUDIX hydrolase [Salipiger marinus]SDI34165.1 8-oxo-dGTP pyrophosphatase MutT, NUDIX family [Salipiger marinus]